MRTWALIRKELASYFAGPLVYVVVGAFLLATGYRFYTTLNSYVTFGFGVRGEIWRSELRDDDAGQTLSRILILVPRASLAWRIRPDLSVRAAVHQANRTPTMN
jgi:outer membrane receptor protein involved in Fe transport